MPDQHLFDTARFLLSYQNNDGGWATYENTRGWKWYELMNPSEARHFYARHLAITACDQQFHEQHPQAHWPCG